MKYIKTGQYRNDAKRHLEIAVSDEDYEMLNQYHWHASPITGAVSSRGGQKKVLMHRLIMNAPEHLEVDHIDGNRLNNLRSNLRLCTSSENKKNRGLRSDTTSGYKGVSFHKQTGKWGARIHNGENYKHLGLFDDKKVAAKVYNEAAIKYHGEFAWTNPI
jgi:hypothetical protein